MPTIHQVKEQEVVETPLILFDCFLPSGAQESWSTHLVQYNSRTYQPRVLRHNLFEMRWGADDGVDSLSRVSLTLANADSFISQLVQTAGWKGSKLTATFLFYDLKNDLPGSDSMVVFQGLLNPPDETTESTLRLSAHNRLNLQRYLLPEVRIQKRCPWSFPTTAAQRSEAVTGGARGKYSPLFRCGYSPDQPSGVGNLNGAVPFTTCDYTRASCVQRGMFDKDSQNRTTQRFGGLEFVPASILVRGHGESSWRQSEVLDNEARYNDFVPIHYGTVWTEPPIVFARNDGNLTRMEVLLGMGEINRVVKVVVNGVEIPQGIAGANMTSTGWYNLVSAGTVSGGFNLEFTDASGNPLGDPYGSMAFLAISTPNRISDGRSLPQVRVLLEGQKLATYDAAGAAAGDVFSNNPAWVVLDMLRRAGWTTAEVDLPSFNGAAAYCAQTISVNDLYGNPQSVPRFQCNLSVSRRRSVSDWIRAVRASSRLYLTYGPTGLLQLQSEANLATQHPTKPAGSNSTTTLNGGWPAYEFGDGASGFSAISRRGNGESSLRWSRRGTAETPNRASLEFQDEFNEYQQDSLSLVDVDDAALTRQEISVTAPASGVANFHQAARVLKLLLDKAIRGNLYAIFETSVKGVGLRPGDLITITYQREGMTRAPFRIVRLAPSMNHARLLIEAQLHNDAWYGDDPGVATGSRVSRRQGGAEIGIPLPLVGSVFDASLNPQFGIVEESVSEGDGSAEIALEAGFAVPVRPAPLGLDVPRLSLTPTILTTGGTLAGGQTLYYAISAVGSANAESDISFIVRADIPSGTNTNRVQLQLLSFSPSVTAFHVYRGANPLQLLRIASSVAIAASYTDSGAAPMLQGPPDDNYDHAQFEWRLELHPEVTATSFGANTIGSTTLQLVPNEHVSMLVRITAGKGAGQERIIASHTNNSITLVTNWTIVPDATSTFVISEPSWHFGATSANSPVRFNVPNRPGATVHICGKAVNAVGRDSGYDLSPITRWQIAGAAGGALDATVPPIPTFALQLAGQGMVEVVAVSFSTLTNTRSILAGTFRPFYWDELTAGTPVSLAAAMTSTATQLVTSASVTWPTGTLLQIEAEILEVQSVTGTTVNVLRGSHGTSAAAHATATLIYNLNSKVYIIAFARDFFGSPASGSFSYPVFLPDARVAAAELFVTNLHGNSLTRRINFTATTDFGLRTLSGGQITMQVEGYLAIQTSATPPLVIETAHSVRDIFAVVLEAPTGAPIQLQLRRDSTVYCSLTIPVSATISNTVNGFGLPALQPMSKLYLDVLSVGQTGTATPGRDLTVTLRL